MSGSQENELEILRNRLAEAEEMLRSIREGEVDAIVVGGKETPAVYTLKTAAEPYRLIVEQMSEGAVTVSSDGVILYGNAAFARMLQIPRERLTGTLLSDLLVNPDNGVRALLERTRLGGHEVKFRTGRGAVVEAQISSAQLIVDGTAVHCLIVTDLSRQELRVLHNALVSSSADAIYALRLDGTIASWNDAAERLFGYTAEEAVGRNFRMLVPPQQLAEVEELFSRALAGEVFQHETTRLTKADAPIDVSLSISPIKVPAGTISAVSVIARDITERRRNEEHIRLLLGELNHRAKNLLAVVQAIVHYTARGDPDTFIKRLTQRIAALAAHHDLLMKSNWQGVEIADIIRVQLMPYADLVGKRILAEGPGIRLKPANVQALGMIIHELTTNAVKYGALSNSEGRIQITWSVGEGDLKVRWSEHDGPPASPPQHHGFGNTVVVRMAEQTFAAKVQLEFPRSGLVWELVAPGDQAIQR